MKVFLGGTCMGTTWRDELMPLLQVDYYNPVITDREWTEEDRQNEIKQRQEADYVLYVFTPAMGGLYAIAELVDDSNKKPTRTVFYLKKDDVSEEGKKIIFTEKALSSLTCVEDLVKTNGVKICNCLQEVADYLNERNDMSTSMKKD